MISPMEKLQGLQEVVTLAQNAANTGGGVTGQGGGGKSNTTQAVGADELLVEEKFPQENFRV